MKYVHWIFVFCISPLLLFGCEGGVPDFEGLGKDKIPQPTLAGKTKSSITLTSPDQLIPITGECDARVQGLEVKINGHTDWSPPASLSAATPQVSCSENKSFYLSLKSLGDLGYWDTGVEFSFEIHLHSLTKAGPSGDSVVTVYYKLPASTKGPLGNLSSAAKTSTSANYKARGRVNSGQSASSSSANYKMEGSISR